MTERHLKLVMVLLVVMTVLLPVQLIGAAIVMYADFAQMAKTGDGR